MEDISEPIFFFFKIFSKFFLDSSSIDSGETAIGNGFRLPLVISTSIKPNDFTGIKTVSYTHLTLPTITGV